jgi:hypothetical protein
MTLLELWEVKRTSNFKVTQNFLENGEQILLSGVSFASPIANIVDQNDDDDGTLSTTTPVHH